MSDTWDVFVCHATEDKGIVAPLAQALRDGGLSVWYDDFRLKLGDSLREALDHGLRNSSFGLVVLSPAFFSKQWPQWELNALVTRQLTGRQRIIIPIWHNLTADDVKAQSPALADLVAANTASGLSSVVEQILDAVRVVGVSESSTGSTAESPTVGPTASRTIPPHGTKAEATRTGHVKWWSSDKGFGFLTPDDGGQDLFVHHTALLMEGFRELTDGQRVRFESERGEKGPKAVNVEPL